jgi:tungstate transport system substrate-binding protein
MAGLKSWIAAALLLAAALQAGAQERFIVMASTTSTEQSGLFTHLLPAFKAASGIDVRVVALGTGQALDTARRGDADLVFVHDQAAEEKFVAEGFGLERLPVMYNDFVLIGPNNDPARVKGEKDVLAAMQKIADAKWKFVSRGDDSGTEQMEKSYWKTLDIQPSGQRWYYSAGQGMGEVLMMAGEMRGYTLTDRGTYIAYRDKIGLPILMQGDARMFNPYGIIAVNPKKYPGSNFKGAKDMIDWITSAEGQKLIAEFKAGGEQLFFPSAK